jgi:hypothetical protein
MPDESDREEACRERYRGQVEEFIRQLSEAERTLQSLTAGEVDAVVDPATAVPILLSRAQDALLRSEAHYRDLVARCPSLVCELAPSGTTLLTNAAVPTSCAVGT